jgi:glycosyltransferase involved in cell wall biosynthesis
MNWCVVIPTYNNEKTLEKVVKDVLGITGDVIVVNDGSTDSTPLILEKFRNIQVVSYAQNQGKGYALKKGFELAIKEGYQYAITVDSDGQHYAKDIAAFIEKSKDLPDALIVGSRQLPRERLRQGSGFANRFSNFWFKFIAGITLPDTQSGFRLYPLSKLKDIHFYTRKYEFELEVLVRSAWRGIPVTSVPISVFYPAREERISHYRPVKDFVRISLLYTVFFFVAVFYIKPFSFLKYLKKENIKGFFNRHILHSEDSTAKITLSVMLGIFMGIAPIWGYQLITAISLAYLLRLNKFLVIVAAQISIPPLIPVILYLSFVTGSIVMGRGAHLILVSPVTFAFVKNNLFQYIIGSITLAVILSLFFGLIMYFIMKLIRKKNRVNIH